MQVKQSVIGIGGVFFKARDPVVLAAWYREHLGVPVEANAMHAAFTDPQARLIWATFPADTQYFAPSAAPFMVNYRVADLDAMLCSCGPPECQWTSGLKIRSSADSAGRWTRKGIASSFGSRRTRGCKLPGTAASA